MTRKPRRYVKILIYMYQTWVITVKSVTPPYLISMLKSRLLESRPRALSPSVFTRLTLDLVKVGNDG